MKVMGISSAVAARLPFICAAFAAIQASAQAPAPQMADAMRATADERASAQIAEAQRKAVEADKAAVKAKNEAVKAQEELERLKGGRADTQNVSPLVFPNVMKTESLVVTGGGIVLPEAAAAGANNAPAPPAAAPGPAPAPAGDHDKKNYPGTPAGASLQSGTMFPDQTLAALLSCPVQNLVYNPLEPIPTGGYTKVDIDDKGNVTVLPAKWPSKPSEVNPLLDSISTSIASSSAETSGALASFFGYHTNHTKYVIDFMKYRVEPVQDQNHVNYGWARVGAGLRVKLDIEKDDGTVSANLWALAASVSAKKVKGSMETNLVGFDVKETTAAMPFTVDLSEANIQKLIEELAIVKTKLYDDNARLSPKLLASVSCVVSTKPSQKPTVEAQK